MTRDRRGAAGVLSGVALVVLAAAVVSCSHPPVARAASAPISAWSTPETIPTEEDLSGAPPTPTPGFGLVTVGGQLEPPPAIAFDAKGDAVALWREAPIFVEPLVELVRTAVRPAGGHWGQAETLASWSFKGIKGHGFDGWAPRVSIDARGDAIAVWESPSGLHAAWHPAGGQWHVQPTLTAPAEAEPPGAEEAAVATDARGDAIVVWPREVAEDNATLGYSTGIEASEGSDGQSFSMLRTISRRENAWHPQIAMDARGDAIATWEAYTAHGCRVSAVTRPALRAWSAPRVLSDDSEACGGDDRVAIAPNGEAIVVWEAIARAGSRVEAAELSSDGRWGRRRVLATGFHMEGLPPPQVAIGARGTAIVDWAASTSQLNNPSLWVRIRGTDHKWRKARQLQGTGRGTSALAMNPRGEAFVIWESPHGIEVAAHVWHGAWRSSRSPATPHSVRLKGELFYAGLDEHGDAVIGWRDERGIETIWHPSLLP